MSQSFFETGWHRFGPDLVLVRWVTHALPVARQAVAAPQNAHWLRCGGTWFAGVNVLPNDDKGAVANGPPVAGEAVSFIRQRLGLADFAWDPAQVSVCYDAYPRPMAAESEAAFRYRRDHDAAHLDGLLRDGPRRRRFLREHHGFILGIPLIEASADASPLVAWEGSHHIMRQALRAAFGTAPPEQWGAIDVTDAYHAARRLVFETCRRVAVVAKPGEAYLVHRLALHGVAPWGEEATAGPDGRMIVYFRPVAFGPADWLARP